MLMTDQPTDQQLGRSTRLFAGDDSTTTTTTGRPPLPGKDKEAAEQAGEVAEAPLFKTPQKPKKVSSWAGGLRGIRGMIECSRRFAAIMPID